MAKNKPKDIKKADKYKSGGLVPKPNFKKLKNNNKMFRIKKGRGR